jgi:hypothetical protein
MVFYFTFIPHSFYPGYRTASGGKLREQISLFCFFVSSPLNTICLHAVDSEGRPVGLGSGCLIRTDGHLVLVGVQHVVDNAKRWCIHLRVIPGQGSDLYGFGAPTYFKRFSADNDEILDLDFFAVVVPGDLQPVHEEVRGLHAISNPIPKRIFLLSDIALPERDERYSFFGAVGPSDMGAFLEVHPQSEKDMTFIAERAEHLIFQLANTHKGDVRYKGCSGAPIVDMKGRLAALVIGGSESANQIFGVPLHHYRSAIAATAMEASRTK